MLVSDLLDAALTTADIRAALQAARELAQQPAAGAIVLPCLAAALADPQPSLVRRAAQVHGALGVLARDNLPALLAGLAHARWTVREAVVEALGQVDPANEAVWSALVWRVLFDRTAAVRDAALAILKRQPGSALAGVRDARTHPHPRIRCRALYALTRLASAEEQLVSLQQALDDSHFRVRRDAAGLLGGLGAAALPAVPRLGRRRFDGEPRVARVAGASLARIASEAPAEVAAWMGRLLDGGDDPLAALGAALGACDLPLSLHEGFIEVCRRRRAWYAGRGQGCASAEPPPFPSTEAGATLLAAGKAGRREAAWLIGWLLEELIRPHQGTTR